MIQKDGAVPLYVQIADWMREQIYQKDWEAGQKLPSEQELQKLLTVSRGTLRKAISLLVKEGLIVQMHGKGTFVSAAMISHPAGRNLLSFAESLRDQGIEFRTKVIEKHVQEASHFLAEKLRVEERAPIFFLKRVRYVGDEPIMIIENRINMALCQGIEDAKFEEQTLFSQLELLSGRRIKYSHSRYAARVLGKERGALLEAAQDAPVLHLEQLIFLENSLPIEWGNVWLKSNRYIVGTVLERN